MTESIFDRMKARQEMPNLPPKPIKESKPVAKEQKPKEKPKSAPKVAPTFDGDSITLIEMRIEAMRMADRLNTAGLSEDEAANTENVELAIESAFKALARYRSFKELLANRWSADGSAKVVEVTP